MADDVESFFKSKKTKKHVSGRGHGPAVQTPEELARRLELTVQQQQALDRENGVDEEDEYGNARPPYAQQVSAGSNAGNAVGSGAVVEQIKEESEWLDVEKEGDVDLAKFGMKEMDVAEDNDPLSTADDDTSSSRKTWNMPGGQAKQVQKLEENASENTTVKEGDDAAVAAVENESTVKEESDTTKQEASKEEENKEKKEEPQKAAAYVAPSRRGQQSSSLSFAASRFGSKKPNIDDSMEFPSLDVAIQLEDVEKTKKKPHMIPFHQTKKSASPAPVERGTPSPVSQRQEAQQPAPPARTAWGQPAQGAAYVPPHMRKQ